MFLSVWLRGVLAGFDGVLFGGQAEGVEAHRVHHALALHPAAAADDVGGRVAFGMADVQAVAAGIGEHVEHVELCRLARACRGAANVWCSSQYACHLGSMVAGL